MCDHCGCREITPIGRLMAEHERLLDLAGEVRAALRHGDEPAARAAFATLVALLRPHVRAEERGLFAALYEADEYVEHLDGLEADHRDLDEAIAGAAACGTAPGASGGAGDCAGAAARDTGGTEGEWARRVPPILDRLRDHIHAEEYGLFPAALATLGGREWDGMSVAWS